MTTTPGLERQMVAAARSWGSVLAELERGVTPRSRCANWRLPLFLVAAAWYLLRLCRSEQWRRDPTESLLFGLTLPTLAALFAVRDDTVSSEERAELNAELRDQLEDLYSQFNDLHDAGQSVPPWGLHPRTAPGPGRGDCRCGSTDTVSDPGDPRAKRRCPAHGRDTSWPQPVRGWPALYSRERVADSILEPLNRSARRALTHRPGEELASAQDPAASTRGDPPEPATTIATTRVLTLITPRGPNWAPSRRTQTEPVT